MVNQSRPFRLTPLTRAQRRRQDATRPRDEQQENRARQAGRPAAGAPRVADDGHKKPGICRVIDPLLTGVVGGTGFEPVTPTMSR